MVFESFDCEKCGAEIEWVEFPLFYICPECGNWVYWGALK